MLSSPIGMRLDAQLGKDIVSTPEAPITLSKDVNGDGCQSDPKCQTAEDVKDLARTL